MDDSTFRVSAAFSSEETNPRPPSSETAFRSRNGEECSIHDFELIAQELSTLAHKVNDLTERMAEVEKVNARLEEAALTTARALEDISSHWDAVYEAMRRKEGSDRRGR
ncbi:MAG: hypothetical protein ICV59_04360 [Thermoleophilia bacterium]|nr:hypothetical protein [Thermoleophilia bacterium]